MTATRSSLLIHGGAQHPAGPFAYLPLFLYMELPWQWLSLHTGVPFTILGKLPIAAGDTLAAAVIACLLRSAGLSDGRVAGWTALFFLNPLVLYNGAF